MFMRHNINILTHIKRVRERGLYKLIYNALRKESKEARKGTYRKITSSRHFHHVFSRRFMSLQ